MAHYISANKAAQGQGEDEFVAFLAQFSPRNLNVRDIVAFSAVLFSFYVWQWVGWALSPS